ncbi:MAG TPA: 2-oxoacid:acceptor oxidoreductase family protein [Desulfatiglandales bacterium]|nr:2-oxoacid:acceptor oxidoreductase family protein [Desulfatiglandales bacterium]
MTRTELTIAGVGGQGSILAGVILGSSAVTYDGKYAVQTQAYSSELRGGFAAAWVIISDEPVVFPRVTRPDVLVAQAQDSINRFSHVLKPDGILIIDSDMIPAPPADIRRVFKVPATSLARNRLKAPVTTNMVMLGALCKATGVVSRGALEKAIVEAVPKGKERLNLDAFGMGFDSVQDLAGSD